MRERLDPATACGDGGEGVVPEGNGCSLSRDAHDVVGGDRSDTHYDRTHYALPSDSMIVHSVIASR